MTYRKRQQRKAMLQSLGLFAAIIATVIFCIWWFPRIDCATATNGLAFIEACENDPDCTLNPRDHNLKKAYIRMQIKSCPSDNS